MTGVWSESRLITHLPSKCQCTALRVPPRPAMLLSCDKPSGTIARPQERHRAPLTSAQLVMPDVVPQPHGEEAYELVKELGRGAQGVVMGALVRCSSDRYAQTSAHDIMGSHS